MITYDVSKEKGGRYYVCRVGEESAPLAGTFCKDKKEALHKAADYNSMSYKEFLKARKSV